VLAAVPAMAQEANVGRPIDHQKAGVAAPGARRLPPLATPESLPRIRATWENAPIDSVVAAFATFSRRRITMAPDVGGFVSATVVDQPWQQALESVMSRQGLRVEFKADSSIYISVLRESLLWSRKSMESLATSRVVSGIVDDDQTGGPIAGARISIIGNQLIDGPNDADSNERGQFSLRVPDGEVWLDACAIGYEFSRVTLAPRDTVAVFHGRRTIERLLPDTVRLSGADIESIEIIKGAAAAALNGIAAGSGIIQITTKNGVAAQWPLERDRGQPVLVIDGVAVNAGSQLSRACGATPHLGYHIQFRIF